MTVPTHQQLLDEARRLFEQAYPGVEYPPNEAQENYPEYAAADDEMREWLGRDWSTHAINASFPELHGAYTAPTDTSPGSHPDYDYLWHDAYESITLGRELQHTWSVQTATAEAPAERDGDQWTAHATIVDKGDERRREAIDGGGDIALADRIMTQFDRITTIHSSAVSEFATTLGMPPESELDPEFTSVIFDWAKDDLLGAVLGTDLVKSVTPAWASLVWGMLTKAQKAVADAFEARSKYRVGEFVQHQHELVQQLVVEIGTEHENFVANVRYVVDQAKENLDDEDCQQTYKEMHLDLEAMYQGIVEQLAAAPKAIQTRLATEYARTAKHTEGLIFKEIEDAYVAFDFHWNDSGTWEFALVQAKIVGERGSQAASALRAANPQGVDVWELPMRRVLTWMKGSAPHARVHLDADGGVSEDSINLGVSLTDLLDHLRPHLVTTQLTGGE